MGTDTHDTLRAAALAYAARSWHVFPLSPRSKKPIASTRGLLDATTDAGQIERWWTEAPTANVGIATGPSGLVVLDPDGEAGAAELRRLVREHGALPRTLTSRTAGGFHLVFRGTGVRSTARGNLHVRGEGGYIVAPPSVHPSGHAYAWAVDAPVADLPDWVRAWREQLGGTSSGDIGDLGAVPAFLLGSGALAARPLHTGEPWSTHDEARLRAALRAIPADNYEIWCQVGMGLHALGWDRSDGTSIARDIWDQWAQTCGEKYSDHAQEFHWSSFGRRSGIGIGTLFHLAQKHGWGGEVNSQAPAANPFHKQRESEVMPAGETDTRPAEDGQALGGPATAGGPFAAPAQSRANGHDPSGPAKPPEPHFLDRDRAGRAVATCRNARAAVEALGIECRYDTFHRRMLVGGRAMQAWAGELTDPAVHVIRVTIEHTFGFDPTAQHTRDAAEQLCFAHHFDPVADYLEEVEWDGRARVGTWMADHLGAADDAYVRAVGALVLRAAVRRARAPGCKWDYVVVLEGAENTGKSTALSVLAGPENFSDQSILAHAERDQQEAVQGVWIYELAELAGMRRAEVERVKAFLTRTSDRARPAYGHYREDRPRRNVFVGTTNTDEYLKSEHGNRRFWPVRTGRIDVDGLRRERDQLWAEAVAIEDRACGGQAGNGRLELPATLDRMAAAAQRERLEADPWESPVGAWTRARLAAGDGSVSADDVLRDCLHMQHREQDRAARGRVGAVLRRLGWEKYRQREGHELSWRYRPAR